MTTPVSPQSPSLVDRLDTLRRTTLTRPVSAAPAAAREPDSAALSAAGRELGELSTLLGRLKSAFASARQGGIAAAQGEIDGVRDSLASIPTRGTREGGFTVTNSGWYVRNDQITATGLNPGEVYDINLEVERAGTRAGIFVEIPGGQLDLGSGESLTLRITGTRGTASISFASSITQGQIFNALNSMGENTGVIASPEGLSGFSLVSADFGSGEFVTVSLVGGNSNVRVGALEDPLHPDGTELVPLDSLDAPLTDFGTDAIAAINGHEADIYGNTVAFSFFDGGPERYFGGVFNFDEFLSPGNHIAFRLRGTYAGQPE